MGSLGFDGEPVVASAMPITKPLPSQPTLGRKLLARYRCLRRYYVRSEPATTPTRAAVDRRLMFSREVSNSGPIEVAGGS